MDFSSKMRKQIPISFLKNYFFDKNTERKFIINADADALGALCLKQMINSTLNTLILTPSLYFTEIVYAGISEWSKIINYDLPVSVLQEIGNNRELIPENEAKRSKTFFEAENSNKRCFIASVNACFSTVVAPSDFLGNTLSLRVGETYDLKQLAARLVGLDYDNEYQVSDYCEFALRGGIIDIYSPLEKYPARIEFFGDEIDNIRLFSTQSQKSIKNVDSYGIVPRSSGVSTEGEYTFLDYFKTIPKIIIIYPDECLEQLDKPEVFLTRIDEIGKKQNNIVRIFENFAEEEGRTCFSNADITSIPLDLSGKFDSEIESIGKELYDQIIKNQILFWLDNEYRISIFSNTELTARHLEDWLIKHDLQIKDFSFCSGQLTRGVVFIEDKQVCLSDKEIFFAPHKRRTYQTFLPEAKEESFESAAFADIDIGDYVVHINHGVGIFHGIKEIKISGNYREVMEIEFDDEVKLYVPIWQAGLVTKYIGAKKSIPVLSRIGEMRWARLKKAAQSAAKTLAAEMLRIQAMRYSCEGYRFQKDDEEQLNFEMAFPYRETIDQIKAANEIKNDLMLPKPMDRLVCGDVGYGKTEVAMRGAFKVVMGGKQVAILAPTTILAQQHYYTFLDRFAEYPVIIEMISRFRKKSEQKKILNNLAEGKVDIIIGTHRLIQNDVQFAELGLVIIDEEQRFGVVHKERFKKLRATVDVLTMTATPIPRTLYLAMAGIRDLSTIMTAPGNRLPVQTVVCMFDDDIIKKAILNEVKRGGQVFFVHNRVQTIEQRYRELKKMLPDVKCAIGHGQMHEGELEEVMALFIDGEIDVFVCTTIIESGVDIPNANTIIIERADMFGLAELYQLRGRVGRWSRQAYAYLLLPKSNIMSTTAKERLVAIRKFTQLGAGFKLALRDLEIRGSGNILGMQQSGHINAVGFALYCQLLKSSIAAMRGKKDICTSDVDLFFDFINFGYSSSELDKLSAGFSSQFITSERLRIDFYRRFSFAVSHEEMDVLEEELKDRFGNLPAEAKLYVDIMKLRLAAGLAGYNSLSVKEGHIFIKNSQGDDFLINDKIPELKGGTAEQKFAEVSELVYSLY